MSAQTHENSHVAEVLYGMMLRYAEDTERYEASLPHLISCTDVDTGEATFSGPFETREQAEIVAAHERSFAEPDEGLVFDVVALYPPMALDQLPSRREEQLRVLSNPLPAAPGF